MSSFEGYESSDELNSAKKGAGQLVISRGDGSELLEIVGETFDQIAFAIECEIGVSWLDPICLWRNHRRDLAAVQMVDEGVGIVSLVRKKSFGIDFLQ
nr:MAG TPA: hypothetical protein [Bacteriophage sp.]